MLVYNYSPVDGAVLGTSEADESPLEPGVWLIPAFATDVPPPAAEAGQAAVWTGEAWLLVDDHRGETVYSTADGSELIIQSVGALPEDVTTEPRPSPLHVWADGAWTLDVERHAAARRAERNRRLDACLWTIARDSPLSEATQDAWIDYRDALRALDLSGDEWPTAPDEEVPA